MTDTQVEYASVIRASGNDLLELLNSILDLAKVESGTVTVELADVSDRASSAHRSAPRVRARGRRQRASATRSMSHPGRPRRIVTDPQRLRQILKNLLANAFKFTEQRRGARPASALADERLEPPRPQSLGAGARRSSPSRSRDTGIGIDDEQQQRIFEAFAQGDGTTARLYGGTGLGLSISRELVALLGGEITVASTPGRGQHVHRLPPGRTGRHGSTAAAPTHVDARPSELPAPLLAADAEPSPSSIGAADPTLRRRRPRRRRPIDGIKILVVDDDFRNIFALTALLERGHAEVTVAESGAEALAALESDAGHRHRPDGHHDAGHGRLRDHAGHPSDRPLQDPPDHRRHRQGDGRRAPALPRRRRQRLRPQAGRHRRAPRGRSGRGCRDRSARRADGAVADAQPAGATSRDPRRPNGGARADRTPTVGPSSGDARSTA